jgi:hypothetical protein
MHADITSYIIPGNLKRKWDLYPIDGYKLEIF